MGNTLEPPGGEGTWGNPAVVAENFDDYKNTGFTCVRLPITWDQHMATTLPYKINDTWLNRIEQIVYWGLSRKLIIIINAHHESWIKNSYTDANVARFDSLWSQIATRFKDKSDSLLFEIINEPYPMTLVHVNELNARIIKIIRKTNPTRIILFSGNQWSNSQELITAAVPQDNFLIGYYHSYDPYPFGLEGPGTYGSDADIRATTQKFDQVTTWSIQHNIPVVLSEFAYTKKCEYNSRMCAYATVVDQALAHNVAFNVWEDGGDFKFYNRPQHTWSEIKDILINTFKESPNKMRINNYKDTLVQLRWNNRTTENDSIIIERGVDNNSFTNIKKVSPTTSGFIDTTVRTGKTYYYRLKANLKDSIEIQSYPVRIVNAIVARGPFTGTAISIPGTIEAENFDKGIEGLSYHDSDFINQGDTYRLGEGVDIYQTGSRIYVGNVEPGEWLEYTISVAEEGTYNISANMAAITAGGEFYLEFKNGATLPFTALASGSLSTFKNVTNTFHLLAGEQIMRLNITKTPEFSINSLRFSVATTVEQEKSPECFQLFDNYPNPFNPSTTIAFNLPSRFFVTLKIFDVIGREIDTIISGELEGGKHTAQWNAQGLPSGVYYCIMQAGDFRETKKLIILK
jgi:aryl-phospho-beta-D-glucosidase BglC (GH1 family)